MDEISLELLKVLNLILPGLVATVIFYSLTSHPRPSSFQILINALIYTTLASICTDVVNFAFNEMFSSLNDSTLEQWDTLLPVGIGIILGIATAWIFNHDLLHRLFRFTKISFETSYPSEWYSSFAKNWNCYVVLHLKDGRRFYGWPEEWPSDPRDGYFRIGEGEWLDASSEEESPDCSKIDVYSLVIPNEIVEMVEFVEGSDSDQDSSNGR